MSLVRIAVITLLLSGAAAAALYRWRPEPVEWQAVGSERIVTPAFDIADEDARYALRWLTDGVINRWQGNWLGDACSPEKSNGNDIYLLTDDGVTSEGPWRPRRTIATLGAASEITHERFTIDSDKPVSRTTRALDRDAAEDFRSLLIEGGYPDMDPTGRYGRCHRSTVTLESCVGGRYYGVVRGCEMAGETPSLDRLAAMIEAFALEATPPAGTP